MGNKADSRVGVVPVEEMGEFLPRSEPDSHDELYREFMLRYRALNTPQYKTVLRSSCHGKAVHQEKIQIPYHHDYEARSSKPIKTGRWICNWCHKPSNVWGKSVLNLRQTIRVGKISKVTGKLLTDRVVSEWYFRRMLTSKKQTYAQCTSRGIGRFRFQCENWMNCNLCYPDRKSWAKGQEKMLDKTSQYSKCPARVNPPRDKDKGGWARKQTLEEIKKEKIAEILENMFKEVD